MQIYASRTDNHSFSVASLVLSATENNTTQGQQEPLKSVTSETPYHLLGFYCPITVKAQDQEYNFDNSIIKLLSSMI